MMRKEQYKKMKEAIKAKGEDNSVVCQMICDLF